MANVMSQADTWVDSLAGAAGPLQGSLRVPATSTMCDPSGRLRLASIAGLCEMVSVAAGESGLRSTTLSWVVRTTTAGIEHLPAVGDWMSISISTAGWGPAWIERRITIDVERDPSDRSGPRVRPDILVSTVWVSFDRENRRPARLQGAELEHWQQAARQRRVGASHVLKPIDVGPAVRSESWPLRESDFDLQGHLNNAAALLSFEQCLALNGLTGRVGAFRVEYRAEVDRSDSVSIESLAVGSGLDGQLVTRAAAGEPAVLFAARFDSRDRSPSPTGRD